MARHGFRQDMEDLRVEYTREDIKSLKYGATTSFNLARKESFMVCPYDSVHVVPSSSFFKHKLKCERKFKEDQGIPDAFNEMQYRNRFRSCLANAKPLPQPPPHVRNLREVFGLSPFEGSSIAYPSVPAAAFSDNGGTAQTNATGTAKPAIRELLIADMNLPYFEPSGLSPAARKEFRARRQAAAAAAGFEYLDMGKGEGPKPKPHEHEAPTPPESVACDDEFQLIEDIDEYESFDEDDDGGKASKGMDKKVKDDEEEEEEEEEVVEDDSDEEAEYSDDDEFRFLKSDDDT